MYCVGIKAYSVLPENGSLLCLIHWLALLIILAHFVSQDALFVVDGQPSTPPARNEVALAQTAAAEDGHLL